ncbi:hypothetical protein PV433_11895 [Paenibacillus sp. GYB004]|uniref:hypothetical protein n=1 Tax=Paenibacillus sp. GYB004 TaxID=2994393 RepID=UPI002F9677C1
MSKRNKGRWHAVFAEAIDFVKRNAAPAIEAQFEHRRKRVDQLDGIHARPLASFSYNERRPATRKSFANADPDRIKSDLDAGWRADVLEQMLPKEYTLAEFICVDSGERAYSGRAFALVLDPQRNEIVEFLLLWSILREIVALIVAAGFHVYPFLGKIVAIPML